MKVADVMTPEPVTIESVSSLDRALELMDRLDIRHLPVLEDGRLAGILSDRDVLEATGWRLHGHGDPDGQVRAHMRMPIESVKPRRGCPPGRGVDVARTRRLRAGRGRR
jgi:acetoin utilization protein AcuB